jgi:hypothetical protein
MRHYLLTNFNVRREDVGARPDRDWLEHRFGLFERFCLPSVAGQTCSDFTWLVRWDESGMPDEYAARLREHEAALPQLRLVPEELAFHVAVRRDLEGPVRLLTTRLDNDDALRRDAVALLQAEAREPGMEFLNLPLGYCLEHPGGRTCLSDEPSNHFLSLAEDVNGGAPQTAVCTSHHNAATLAPVRQVGEGPSWLRVVHGRNLVNAATGEPCQAPDLRGLFNVSPRP